MGTRSLTFIYDADGEAIINLYRQFDGYMSRHGKELAEFLNSKTVVNGLVLGSDYSKFANGMGCLAASLVAHFKIEAGRFYLHPVKDAHCGQDYEYHVYHDKVIVKDGWNNTKVLFIGSWEDFLIKTAEPQYDE